jgi:hypothetical protein
LKRKISSVVAEYHMKTVPINITIPKHSKRGANNVSPF